MTAKSIVGLLALQVLTACGSVETRLCNDTTFEINAVVWEGVPIDSMRIAECTEYQTEMMNVYETTNVTFRVQTDAFYIQPIDHVGETKLGDGQWSYHLTIADYATRDADVHATRD